MIEEIVNYILEAIRSSGAWGVVIGVMIESILAPIPSPIIIMGAGFIMLPAGAGFLQILPQLLLSITVPGAIATTVGSFIGYSIGYYGGKPLINRFNWLLGVDFDELEQGTKKFAKGPSDELTIFFFRAIPVFPLSVFSAVAGVTRINWKTFAVWTFLGALVRVFVLGIIGWMMGNAYVVAAGYVESLEKIGTILLLGLVIAGFFYLYRKKKTK